MRLGRSVVTVSAVSATLLAASARAAAADTAPRNLAPPRVTGSAVVGATLRSDSGRWSGTPSPTIAYAWERCDRRGANCDPIPGARTSSYVLVVPDAGSTVRAVVGATSSAGGSVASSAPTAVVLPRGAPPRANVQPDVSGTPRVGRPLSVAEVAWTGTGPFRVSFAWQRCDSSGRCTTIRSATRQRYVATAADVGFRLRAIVTASNAYGAGTVTTNLTAATVEASGPKPSVIAAPVLSGSASQGSRLTMTTGSWRTHGWLRFVYGWLRCDDRGGACNVIAGAHGATYTVSPADVGHTVRGRVTAAAGSSTATATTTASPVVVGTPDGLEQLPDGTFSVDVESIALPQRLVISAVTFTPARLTSRRAFTARFRVTDTRGYAVRGAAVHVVALPYGVLAPAADARTDSNGLATTTLTPTSRLSLRDDAVVLFVRAWRASGSLLGGVSTRRLVQIPVGTVR